MKFRPIMTFAVLCYALPNTVIGALGIAGGTYMAYGIRRLVMGK